MNRFVQTWQVQMQNVNAGRTLAAFLVVAMLTLAACFDPEPEPTPEPTPTATATAVPPPPTATPEPTATPAPPTATPEPTSTPEPTATPTPEPSPTATPQIAALFEYSRAVRLLEVQEFDDSIAAFGLVIRKLPEFARAYHGRGLAFYGDERLGLALEDFDTAIGLEPEYGPTYVARARLYIDEGETAKAVADLETALSVFSPVREGREIAAVRALLDSIR